MNIHSIDCVYRFRCGACGYIREFGSESGAQSFMHEHNRMHLTTTSGWEAASANPQVQITAPTKETP